MEIDKMKVYSFSHLEIIPVTWSRSKNTKREREERREGREKNDR
jgi:hypothetical protein